MPLRDYKRSTSLIGNLRAPRKRLETAVHPPPRLGQVKRTRLAYVKRDRSAEWSARRGRAGDLNPSARIIRSLV